jgi:hypothetical protein
MACPQINTEEDIALHSQAPSFSLRASATAVFPIYKQYRE